MKRTTKYFFILPLMVFMVSCMPKSKEAYLERFEHFVERVEEHHKKYSKKDWEWADSQLKKYNSEWYPEFHNEFTLQDQIKIKSLIIKYHSLKNKESFGNMLRDLLRDDANEIGEKVEEYIDNDMDEDLEKVIDGVSEIEDSAVKVLEDVIEKLDETF